MKTFRTGLTVTVNMNREGVIYYNVAYNRTAKRIKTKYRLNTDEWDNTERLPSTYTNNDMRKQHVEHIRNNIEKDITMLEHSATALTYIGEQFNAGDIVRMFRSSNKEHSLFGFMNGIANNLRKAGRTRTSETYISAMRSFRRFAGNRDIRLHEIDNELIMQYETYLKIQGICRNTSSFYMRILRATYNRAVERGLTTSIKPFRRVYTGVEKTVKRAVTIQTIKRIKNAKLPDNSSLKMARDMFMFSFYTRGMSFVDMAFLKKDNLKDGLLSYKRRKTGQRLYIKWEQCMQDIIDIYPTGNEYLLPIITEDTDTTRQYKNAQHLINNQLKKLMATIGCDQPLTMYVARHSWASIAHSKHIPISVICECMGHDSEFTTRIYLASLDSSEADKANRKILNDL